MQKNKERIVWLDAAKGIAIALVVAAHSIGGEWSDILSPIRIPLFFIAAGYTLNLRKWRNHLNDFFKKRVRHILLPFFLLELLFWPIWSIRGMFLPPVGTSLPPFEALGGILEGNSIGLPLIALWFLPCFFLAELIFLFAISADRDRPGVKDILVAICLSILGYVISLSTHLPWGLDIALFVQGFLLTGRWLRSIGLHNLPAAGCGIISVLLLAAQFHYNGCLNLAAREYGTLPILAYASAIGGSILLMRILQLLMNNRESLPAEIGRRSMAVYVLHPFVQIVISDILLSTIIEGDYGTIFYIWQAGILITILGILFPLYVSRHWAQKPFIRYLGL